MHAEFGGQFLHSGMIGGIHGHQHVGDGHLQPLFAQEANGLDGSLERVRQLGDGIVNFGTMRVDADLDGVHVQFADSPRFPFVDHDRVGLDLDVEQETPGVLDQFKEVAAHKDLAAAEGEKENARLGQLIEHIFDFGGRHLAVVVVVEITMHAALVAAIRDVQVHGEGHAQLKGFLAHLTHQASSGLLRGQRLIGNEKNSVAGKIGDELLGIGLSLFGIDVELLADAIADNFPQRSAAVSRLKNRGCDLVQREER